METSIWHLYYDLFGVVNGPCISSAWVIWYCTVGFGNILDHHCVYYISELLVVHQYKTVPLISFCPLFLLSSSPLKVKEDDEVDNLDINLDVKKKSKRVYQSPSPEVGLKISWSLKVTGCLNLTWHHFIQSIGLHFIPLIIEI